MANENKTLSVNTASNGIRQQQDTLSVNTASNAIRQQQDTLSVNTASNGIRQQQDTLSVDNWKLAEYQGKTLTVDQQKAKDAYDKKVAEMKNNNGDRKREKREPSKDKFKDEDVVKYMYEDWFLGALSWICNKIEDKTLGLIDAAGNMWLDRRNKRIAETNAAKDEKLKEAREKLETFNKNTRGQNGAEGGQASTALDDVVTRQTSGYQKVFDELGKKLKGEPFDETVLNASEPWVKDLEAHPEKAAEFLEKAPQELENRVKMIEGISKLSTAITSLEMSDEMMREDKKWRAEDGKYRSDDDLKAEFVDRSVSRFEKIKEALDSINQDPSNQTAEQRNAAVNEFLQKLSEKTKELQEKQLKNVEQNRFDAINKAPDKEVAKGIKEIDEVLARRGGSFRSSRQTEAQDLREATQPTATENANKRTSADLDRQESNLNSRRTMNETRKNKFNNWKNNFKSNFNNLNPFNRQKGGRE